MYIFIILYITNPVVYSLTHTVAIIQLLIVFELGTMVLWDLKSKIAEARFQCIDVSFRLFIVFFISIMDKY